MTVPTLSNFQSNVSSSTGNPVVGYTGYTPAAGCNKLFVAITIANSGTTLQQATGVTYNGNAMSLVKRDYSVAGGNFTGCELWQVDDPLSLAASGDISVNGVPDSTLIASGVVVFSGHGFKAGAADVVQSTTTETSSTVIDDTITPLADDSIVLSIITVTGTPTLVASSPHVEDIQIAPNFGGLSVGHTDDTGTPNADFVEWTMGASQSREVLVTAAFAPPVTGTVLLTLTGSGGYTFAGAGVHNTAKAFIGAGGLGLAGVAAFIARYIFVANGGLILGGQAILGTEGIIGNGLISFGGAAAYNRVVALLTSGGIVFGGEALMRAIIWQQEAAAAANAWTPEAGIANTWSKENAA